MFIFHLSYGIGCKLVELTSTGAKDVYDNKIMKNHHGGVIKIGDHLYGYSDGYGWVCQEFKSGELVWNEKKALGKGAIAYADGMFYCLGEGDGRVILIEATLKVGPQKENSPSRLKPTKETQRKSLDSSSDFEWQDVSKRSGTYILLRH